MNVFAKYLRAKLKERKMTQTRLAEITDSKPTQINAILQGRAIEPANFDAIVEALDLNYDEAVAIKAQAAEEVGKVRLRKDTKPHVTNMRLPQASFVGETVPVYGRSEGDGTYYMDGKEYARAQAVPQLAGVPGAYALYIDSEADAPRYKPGETIWLHPARFPAPGNDVLLVCKDDTAMLGEYVKRDGSVVTIRDADNELHEIEAQRVDLVVLASR